MSLKAWLSANRLAKILNKLAQNDVTTLEDLQILENEDEIEAFGDWHKIMTVSTQIFSMLPYIGRPGYHSNRIEKAHNLDFGVPYRLSPKSM